MTKCSHCGKKIIQLPFKCKFCGEYFCTEHHLPENHECIGLKGYKREHREHLSQGNATVDYMHGGRSFELNKPKNKVKVKKIGSIGKLKKFIMRKLLPNKVRKWINKSEKILLRNFVFLIIYGLILLMIYKNIHSLNDIIYVPSIKLASLLLLIVSILFLERVYRTFKSILNFYEMNLSTNQKVILIILFAIVLSFAYTNQETFIPQITSQNKTIKYNHFNPFKTNLTEINAEISEVIGSEQESLNDNTYEIELLVLRKTNKIRRNNGLKELTWDPMLADIARKHSLEMSKTGLLSHINEEGEGPTERAEKRDYDTLKKDGLVYQRGIGENIGLMPLGNVKGYGNIQSNEDVAEAMVESWMNSPGHRANILNSNYEFIGVGVAFDTNESYYYLTQNFK